MITFYWLVEYGKVLFGYLFLMFVWPSVVFRRHLRGKSKLFRFGFCATAQVVIVNTVVLSLGLFHILNRWVVVILFYGLFLWNLLKEIHFGREEQKKIQGLLLGTYGIKSFLFADVTGWLKGQLRRIWKEIRPHFGEYLLLFVILIYGMIYFSYGAFQDCSYGFGDLYTHHSWIYGLMEGKIFSAGIYPEGMHCFIYGMYALLNIKVYSILLFLQGIHTAVFLLSAYSLAREVFHTRYTPLFVLVLFLILDLKCHNAVASMSRLQWTLPQEFGLHTQFLCDLYMIRYLNASRSGPDHGKKRFRLYWDENLLVFTMSLAASIASHFYPAIMAFFLCVSFALFSLKKIFTKGHFLPLVISAICGVLIAAAPMAGAYASGIEFQGSIGWAMNIINTSMGIEEGQEGPSEGMTPEGTNPEETPLEEIQEKDEDTAFVGQEEKASRTFAEKISEVPTKAAGLCMGIIRNVYRSGYTLIYGTERAKQIVTVTVFAILLWLVYRLFCVLWEICLKRRIDKKCFDGYMPMIFASFLYMAFYDAQSIGLPQLVDGVRLCSSIHILTIAVIFMPVDMLLSLLALLCREVFLQILTLLSAVGICASTILLGCYHGYLYYELTRYNSVVMVTNSIIETLPRYTYTIVSPTDEMYQTILYGWHEELLSFLERSTDETYMLPTEYVFIYVEKRPIRYAQNHFFSGPPWLALEKDQYAPFATQCPEIDAAKISQEAAQEDIMRFSNSWWIYTQLESRTILESKAYEWCQRFAQLYPYEMNIYYEDDDFVCYYFRQEPTAPYSLGIG